MTRVEGNTKLHGGLLPDSHNITMQMETIAINLQIRLQHLDQDNHQSIHWHPEGTDQTRRGDLLDFETAWQLGSTPQTRSKVCIQE